ncbi:MAG: hypothetical protein LBP62_03245 [Clostridiales bacterium]|jgi:hypothetical protein|nr:hypothetical protein [Clostridiales bacterium]
MDKKNRFKRYFRRGKSANRGHPTYIYAERDGKLEYVGLTHAEITEGVRNIPLDKNPNPNPKENEEKSYIRPKTGKEDKKKFGSRLPDWEFAESDKKSVQSVIDKNKKAQKKESEPPET